MKQSQEKELDRMQSEDNANAWEEMKCLLVARNDLNSKGARLVSRST